ncbi:MAG: hypothetical protein IJQ12_07105 [Lachnospiraceae bacterium]|nr:hypothetical protein [Lachnospiraceae bacterium]
MLKGKTPEEYIALLEEMERNESRDLAFIDMVRQKTDEALSSSGTEALLAMESLFSEEPARTILARSAELLKLRYLITAVRNEQALGLPLLIRDIDSCDALLTRYDEINLMLRRIELDLAPLDEEALTYLREHRISPYCVSAVLYNMISSTGHREHVLLRIAEDAMDHGAFLDAYGFLNVIEQPSPDTVALKNELQDALTGGGSA